MELRRLDPLDSVRRKMLEPNRLEETGRRRGQRRSHVSGKTITSC